MRVMAYCFSTSLVKTLFLLNPFSFRKKLYLCGQKLTIHKRKPKIEIR